MAETGIIRGIGDLEFEITIHESHRDEMTITAHPVERGAAITDHVFRNPAQLTVKVSASPAYLQDVSLADAYQQILDLQTSGIPVEVQTGKRLYDSMLVKSTSVETDAATENVLTVTVQLQEVILVDTQETTLPSSNDRQTPDATHAVADTGTKSTQANNAPPPGGINAADRADW